MKNSLKLVGPFTQLLTMNNLPKGPIMDEVLEIIPNAGVLIKDDTITEIADFNSLLKSKPLLDEIATPSVCLPGFIDAHTHICYAGSRAKDYALRIGGTSYMEISKRGGGILETVSKTRDASLDELIESLKKRCDRHLADGTTTCEVKSGYGLNLNDELKMLQAIKKVNHSHPIDLVATCLAAHVPPKEFAERPREYLSKIVDQLFPIMKQQNLTNRVDIFIEENAFSVAEAKWYLAQARLFGFSITVHGDQFTPGGSSVACEYNAVSVDHLENSSNAEIKTLAHSNTIGVVLPGASLGLGMPFAPARKLLDAGVNLAIASDWNPGSAPMGDLLLQAAVLGAAEKLSSAETLTGITSRAAAALELSDRGILASGNKADFISFPCDDYREILYCQGKLKPGTVWKNGQRNQHN
jgi:imidazolonepropionase